MRRTGRTPIDDDAEKTEIRPLEASMPLSIMGSALPILYGRKLLLGRIEYCDLLLCAELLCQS